MASKLYNLNKAVDDEFRRWISREGQKHLSILVTGKTSVGKSRLVNALVGKSVAIEGQQKTPCTATVNKYSAVIHGIEVLVWDSPGLQDGTCNEELYLEDMRKQLHKGLDVMIYCIKMDDKCFHKADKNAILALTRKFGNDLWKNAVIALTFANKIEDPDGGDEEAYFRRDFEFWRKEIFKFFDSASELKTLDSATREIIPLVPVGICRKLKLPFCENWLSALWMSCYNRTNASARINLYRINKNRVRFDGSENLGAACSSESDTSVGIPDHNIPGEIPLNREQQEAFWKNTWESFKCYCFTVLGRRDIVAGLGFAVLITLFVGSKKL